MARKGETLEEGLNREATKKGLSMNDYSKLAATGFLMLVGLAAIIIAVWDLMQGRAIPDAIQTILSAGVSAALYTLGINHGAQISIASAPAMEGTK